MTVLQRRGLNQRGNANATRPPLSLPRRRARTGYSGWLSGEFMPLPDADTAGLETLAYMRPLVES